MPNIVTITGPSGSGKSVILKMIEEVNSNYHILPKYTTRAKRKDDDDSIINVDKLPEDCDYRYIQYGEEYGFSSEQIYNCLANGKKPVIIVNDKKVLELLHMKYGNSIRSYFVHRGKPNIKRLIEINNARGITDPDVINERFAVAKGIYGMYTDEIQLFNSIILNTGTLDETKQIVQKLFREHATESQRNQISGGNKIFIVAGNPGSGKDYIAKAAEKIGCVQVKKHTSRIRNPNDGSEMVCSDDSEFDLMGCDLKYKNYGETEYGIKTDDIWKNLIFGTKSQVLVCSDIETIKQLKSKFGENVFSLYVHSDITPAEYFVQEAEAASDNDYIKQRIKGFKNAHRDYANNINLYDRCLIYADDQRELLHQFVGILGIKFKDTWLQEKRREHE